MTTLIVSGARPRISKGGITTSVLLHSAIIAAAALGTAQMVRPTGEKVEEHVLVYEAPKPAPTPAPKVDEPKKVHVAPPKAAPAPKAPAVVRYQKPQPKAPVLTAPTKIAVTIPPVDMKAAPTISDVVAVKVADPGPIGPTVKSSSDGDVDAKAGSSKGLGSGVSRDDGSAYSEAQVEREVQRLPGSPAPRYPESLRSAGISGDVLMRFIVGTNGRVESNSIEIVSSPNPAFAEAVRTSLLNSRFRPAEVGGHAVRQLVEQSFTFKLDR
jgi:protein TonB